MVVSLFLVFDTGLMKTVKKGQMPSVHLEVFCLENWEDVKATAHNSSLMLKKGCLTSFEALNGHPSVWDGLWKDPLMLAS